ncbi:MAG: MBL fold metallo-hydrolase [Clostridiales bacterium]|nr:MBL fold metallo-hydrolase [Clostridiales bacterium]
MKLTVLMENTACRDEMVCEHGLSLYIEANGQRILFDAGQTGAFADNAERLGIDLRQVDLCVLSHGHYDHGGGLGHFLEINDHAKVYVSRHAFGDYYNAEEKYIGLDWALLGEERIVFVGDNLTLSDTLSLHTCEAFPQPYFTPASGLMVKRRDMMVPDDFRHEMYLLIREGARRILISGCSHKGVMNIKTWFAPDVFIGGFHLMKLDPVQEATRLKFTAMELLKQDTVYYTGHCTGDKQFAALKGYMGERLHALSTGITLEI